MTTNTDTQAHGGGVEAVRRIASLLDENAECYSENAMDRAFLGNSEELAALIVEYLALAASPAAPAPAAGVDKAFYEVGNCLRGYFSGHFSNDDEAWSALSDRFNRSFPSKERRSVEMRKTIRIGKTAGGNETDQDRKIREEFERSLIPAPDAKGER